MLFKELDLMLCKEPACMKIKQERHMEKRRRQIEQDRQVGRMLEERNRIVSNTFFRV